MEFRVNFSSESDPQLQRLVEKIKSREELFKRAFMLIDLIDQHQEKGFEINFLHPDGIVTMVLSPVLSPEPITVTPNPDLPNPID